MTNTDNKDPQIQEAFEKWWIDTRMHGHNILPDYKDAVTNVQWEAWQAATEQQAEELKQLRADNEISESTQAALYESLLIIQRKYAKLRAERAGLERYIDEELAILAIGGCDPTSNTQRQVLHKLKSKLTDSAQSGEGKQCD